MQPASLSTLSNTSSGLIFEFLMVSKVSTPVKTSTVWTPARRAPERSVSIWSPIITASAAFLTPASASASLNMRGDGLPIMIAREFNRFDDRTGRPNGYGLSFEPTVYHWNGFMWTKGIVIGAANNLNSVFMLNSGDVWTVGGGPLILACSGHSPRMGARGL